MIKGDHAAFKRPGFNLLQSIFVHFFASPPVRPSYSTPHNPKTRPATQSKPNPKPPARGKVSAPRVKKAGWGWGWGVGWRNMACGCRWRGGLRVGVGWVGGVRGEGWQIRAGDLRTRAIKLYSAQLVSYLKGLDVRRDLRVHLCEGHHVRAAMDLAGGIDEDKGLRHEHCTAAAP